MKKKFSVEQIVSVLKQAEVGVPVAELIRKAVSRRSIAGTRSTLAWSGSGSPAKAVAR